MKKKLDNKEMDLISGGFIKLWSDGQTYIVVETADDGKEVFVNCKNHFSLALKRDWDMFKNQYIAMNINSLEELAGYYHYGYLTPEAEE